MNALFFSCKTVDKAKSSQPNKINNAQQLSSNINKLINVVSTSTSAATLNKIVPGHGN